MRIHKRTTTKEDGRYLIYYTFQEDGSEHVSVVAEKDNTAAGSTAGKKQASPEKQRKAK